MLTLAFYKGRGRTWWHRMQDAAIRTVTRSAYSHVELITSEAQLGGTYVCLSASGRDGGVRSKRITLKEGHWDLVPYYAPAQATWQFFQDRMGAPYDLTGAILCPLPMAPADRPDRWFCSEIIAASLGYPDPHRMSPQKLFEIAGGA